MRLFAGVGDPRQSGKVVYHLPEILLLVLRPAIRGADSIVENGIPGHGAVGKLLAVIERMRFSDAFAAWTKEVLESIPEYIAIDENMRRRTMNGKIPPAHIIRAMARRKMAGW